MYKGILVNSQTNRLVDIPTRRQNVVLVDKKKVNSQTRKNQLVDIQKTNSQTPKKPTRRQNISLQRVQIIRNQKNIFFYFKGLKLSYFQIFLVQFYQVLYTQRDLNDDVDETKSFDVIYHPPFTLNSMRLIGLNSCQLFY